MKAAILLLNENDSAQHIPQQGPATSVFLTPLLLDYCCGVKMRCRASNAQCAEEQALRCVQREQNAEQVALIFALSMCSSRPNSCIGLVVVRMQCIEFLDCVE